MAHAARTGPSGRPNIADHCPRQPHRKKLAGAYDAQPGQMRAGAAQHGQNRTDRLKRWPRCSGQTPIERRPGSGIEQHCGQHSFGCGRRHLDRQAAAHRVADEHRLLDTQNIEGAKRQRGEVGELRLPEAEVLGVAVTGGVDRNNEEPQTRYPTKQVLISAVVLPQAMQEHQGNTPTTHRYADLVSVVEFQHMPGERDLFVDHVGCGVNGSRLLHAANVAPAPQ